MFSSTFLARVMVALIVLSVLLTFWKTMVMNDFIVIDDVESESEIDEAIDL